MALSALRDDALATTADGLQLRLSLPWIRSMPLSCLRDLAVEIDGEPVDLRVQLGSRDIAPDDLVDEPGWWYLQDRLVLALPGIAVVDGCLVAVAFQLMVPYLGAGADAPLVLPFRVERELRVDAASARPSVSADVS